MLHYRQSGSHVKSILFSITADVLPLVDALVCDGDLANTYAKPWLLRRTRPCMKF